MASGSLSLVRTGEAIRSRSLFSRITRVANPICVGQSTVVHNFLSLIVLLCLLTIFGVGYVHANDLERDFNAPPDAARPWVYWYFMDGHITREGLLADLEAMKKQGIGGALFLTINIGVPKGPVPFMSEAWQELFVYACKEADRLGIEITFGVGPGWAGSGGPWVKPQDSMQHLVASLTRVGGGKPFDAVLAKPQPREPFFGRKPMTPAMLETWKNYYRDERVVAYPTPAVTTHRVAAVNEKALYHRAPYTSSAGVRPYFDAAADVTPAPAGSAVDPAKMIDLTDKMDADGRLKWDAPAGDWTVYRFGLTLTGQTTRPAPAEGLGFETDKFEPAALAAHARDFLQPLIDKVGKPSGPGRGLTALHLDSWEMGAQNWSPNFRKAFAERRGYDPLPFAPALIGQVVTDAATTERFLWDLRQTSQELIFDVHMLGLAALAHKNGLSFSTEPYDMNPASDLKLFASADVPMCEFWSPGYYKSEFSVTEATSAAHTNGKSIVGAEAFTAGGSEQWQQYPAVMKAQTDWALAAGVNRFVFHCYQHQSKLNDYPGMGMGAHGVHWERTQTWWDFAHGYHTYLSRASVVMRRGVHVADILYMTPEGAPHVFRPPGSATTNSGPAGSIWPDRRGYNFDGVDPDTLMNATVRDGRIAFAGGTDYGVLVLPKYDTMTPKLLGKIKQLLDDGATVIGPMPRKSPGLSGQPASDDAVAEMAAAMWGDSSEPRRTVGRGRLINDAQPRQDVTPPAPMANAKWIWPDNGLKGPPAVPGQAYFRGVVTVPTLDGILSADLTMTADNAFEAFVNGQRVGIGNNFREIAEFDVTKLLKAGENVVTVTATNAGDGPNSAGLIGRLQVRYADGRYVTLNTNSTWKASTTPDQPPTGKVKVIGGIDAAPWKIGSGVPIYADLYTDYDTAAAALRENGVKPDFESDAPLRYAHRRDGEADLYFVSNPTDQPVAATATFRVSGRQPEWWDPTTGQRRDLPEFTEADGLTRVPLAFDPHGSGFVIFRRPSAPAQGGKNFAAVEKRVDITGPWKVAFDPAWGGPADVTFDTLDDWSKRPEPGIRHYSGKAVYRRTFDVPSDTALPAGERFALSLGDVKAMAHVTLNGRDLGVVWCPPFRVDVPAGVVRATGNELTITVANLWINRLIGDAAVPKEKRYTSEPFVPFKPNAPLQPSGLLGPVTLGVRAE